MFQNSLLHGLRYKFHEPDSANFYFSLIPRGHLFSLPPPSPVLLGQQNERY